MNEIDKTVRSEKIINVLQYKEQGDTSGAELSTFKLLSTDDVSKHVTRAATKSCSLDPISTDLLKQCMEVLVEPITDIVNSSLREGDFPHSWKCAIVTP